MIRALTAAALIISATPAGAENIFVGDWSRPVALGGPATWRYLHTMGPGAVTIEPDPTSSTGRVARFVVRPGDKVGGWSGERAEVSHMQDASGRPAAVNAASGREFYGLSVKVPANWQPPERNARNQVWGLFFQLHGPDDLHASPSVGLDAGADFHLTLHGGALINNRRGGIEYPRHYRFTDGSLNRGRWVQFLMEIKWSADDDGWVLVWRRDQGARDFVKVAEVRDVATLQYGTDQPIKDHYWKAGFYRSEGRLLTHELWLGPVVRGTDRNEVAKAAFGRP